MQLFRRVLFALGLWWSCFVATEEQRSLSLEDRIYDLEAQISTMKSELASTQSLAEQQKPSAFNPAISVIGDMGIQGGFGFKKHEHDDHAHEGHDHAHGHEFKNGFVIREIEFEFRGDVDPYADAMIALAIEPGDFQHVDVHLEEAYARLKAWPWLGRAPLGLITKLGRFRTAIGRMGRVHLHNIPQITYPLAMRSFLGDEGYSSQGVSFNAAFNPSVLSAVNLFLEGVTLNRLPMQKKGAEKMPSGIGHVWWHQELAPFHYLDVGVSGLFGRQGKAESGLFFLGGGDLHYSYVPAGYGQNPLFLMGSETFTANAVSTGRWPLGNFTWAQVRLIGSSFFGVRYDLAPQEDQLQKFQHAIGGYLSYYTTEFLRFRLGYEHVMPTISSFSGDHRFMLSMNFILGSHPVEPYFVNR